MYSGYVYNNLAVCFINVEQLWYQGEKDEYIFFLQIFGFYLVCAKFGGITSDFKVWLLNDPVFGPSENLTQFLKTDFTD